MSIKKYILFLICLICLICLGLIIYIFKEEYIYIYLPKNTYSFHENYKYTRGIREIIPVNIGWNKYGKIKIEDNINIIHCSNINDIIDTVNTYNNINIRGGGHDYNNSSLLGNTIYLTLNFSLNNNNFIMNKKDETIECVANANFGQLYDFLINNGNYIIPGGTCPNVGISGFTLGGGQSILLSHYGPLCNYLKCISYVNSNGKYIKNDKNIEIIRGGGHIKPYIITSFTYDLKLLKPKLWYYGFLQVKFINNNFTSIDNLFKYIQSLKNEKILGPFNITTSIINNNRKIDNISIQLIDDSSISNIKKVIDDIQNIDNIKLFYELIENKSIYEIYKYPINIDNYIVSIDTLSDGLKLNKSGYSSEYIYNSFYISDIYNGIKITQDIIDSFPDWMGFDHYVYNKYIYDNTYKSIFPIEKEYNGWILQSISNDNTSDLIYNTNNVPNCFTKKNNYKYINYPPTSDNNSKNIHLDIFFNKDTVKKIKKYKNKHDSNSKFVTIYN